MTALTRSVIASLAVLLFARHAAAADEVDGSWKPRLNKESAPESTPWTDPALIAYTVNNDGKDSYQVNLSAGLSRETFLPWGAYFSFGGNVVVQKTNLTTKPQDNLEGGLKLGLFHAGPALSWNFSHSLDVNYARTATFPVTPAVAACTVTPLPPNCVKQHKESIRAVYAVVPFPGTEGNLGPLAVSFAPKFSLFNDSLTKNVFNAATGARETGGYFGGLAGLALAVGSSFDKPGLELKVSGHFRERFHVSDSRRASVRKTAGLISADLTYYLLRPAPETEDYAVGVGLSYEKGHDPLTGKAMKDAFVLALKIGFYKG